MNTLHAGLRRNARRRPRHIAIIDGERRCDYLTLWQEAGRLGDWLARRFPPGARIGILLPNSLEAAAAVYGISAAGLICVPLDIALHPRNIEYVVEDGRISLLITSPRYMTRLKDIHSRQPIEFLLSRESEDPAFGLFRLEKRSGHPPPTVADGEPIADEAAAIMYTTGTTGPRKGVVLSHSNLSAAVRLITNFMNIGSDIVESLPMSMAHSFGFARLRCVLTAGGTAIVEPGLLRPEWLLHRMQTLQANALAAVPAAFAILLARFEKSFREVGPGLKYVEIGSDFMPRAHKQRLLELCPKAHIGMHYGLTEASRACFLDLRRDAGRLDTAGRPSPGVHISIRDEQGEEASAGEPGEIHFQGNVVARGYWGKSELSRKTFHGGWIRTGDHGYLDADGYLHLLGRREDILNLGGRKVAPLEVESILERYSGVREAAVTQAESRGIPEEAGLKAWLVVDDPECFDHQGLRRYCLREMEAYKIPLEFSLAARLPRSKSGKLQRRRLTEKKQNVI